MTKTALKTPAGQLSYPHLFEPQAFEGSTKEFYSVTVVFAESTDISSIEKACADFIKETFGDKKLPNNFRRSPVLDGDDKGFPGCKLIRLKSQRRPQVVGRDLEPIDPQDPDGIYPGAIARVSFNVYAYDVSGNRGIALGLSNVQKLKDGERLVPSNSAEDDFDDEIDDDLL